MNPGGADERDPFLRDQGAAQQGVARLDSDWLEAAAELEQAGSRGRGSPTGDG